MKSIIILAPLSKNSLNRYLVAADRMRFSPYFIVSLRSNIDYGEVNNLNIYYTDEITNEPHNLIDYVGRIPNLYGLIAGGEFTVGAAEFLAKRMKLTTSLNGYFGVLRNKLLMREAFTEKNVDQPRVLGSASCRITLEELATRISKFPVISKPVDMAGSWFVSLNFSAVEIINNAGPIFDYKSAKATNLPFSGLCMLEEYFEGEEYSAEIIVYQGELLGFFVNKKILSPLPYFNEIGHVCGVKLSREVQNNLSSNIDSIIRASDANNTILHMEFRVASNGDIGVIEVGCRVAGDYISNLVELSYGLSLEEVMICLKANIKPEIHINPQPRITAIRFITSSHQGLLNKHLVIERMMNKDIQIDPNIEDTHISNRVGYDLLDLSLFTGNYEDIFI